MSKNKSLSFEIPGTKKITSHSQVVLPLVRFKKGYDVSDVKIENIEVVHDKSIIVADSNE
jgi:hypothetical protein